MPSQDFLILDSHALLFRAYYALIRNPLINSKGVNTSALFGFSRYLLHLMDTFPDAHIAAAFDSPGPTLRKQRYSEYKANRSAVPDELKEQLHRSRELTQALGIPCFHKEGYEADDLINDLAKWGSSQGYTVRIVSKDKDLMQLVTDSIHLFAPGKNYTFDDMGPEQVFEKMGVYPDRIVDLLALMGDSSDNIPGIPGVGPKTAIKLLESCDSVDVLLEDPSRAHTKKIAEKVRTHREELILSLELVQFHHTGITLTPSKVVRQDPAHGEIQRLFDEFEFSSLFTHPFFQRHPITTESALSFSTTILRDPEEFAKICADIETEGVIAFDTETTSLECHEAELVGFSLACSCEEGWYIPLGHENGENAPREKILPLLQALLENPRIEIVGQNLKYDMQVLYKYDITMEGPLFDTMVAAYILGPDDGPFNLEHLAQTWLSYRMQPIEDLLGSKRTGQLSFAAVEQDVAGEYAVEDVVVPLCLRKIFIKKLTEMSLENLYYSLEAPLISILASMEYTGIYLDASHLAQLEDEYCKGMEDLKDAVFTQAGEEFNLNSPKQLGHILFEKLGLPKGKKTKTGYSTRVDILEKLAPTFPIVKDILAYREKQKLYSTYIRALPEKICGCTGRVHTSFMQTGTATGRLSSKNPNLQNIPVKTPEGRLIRSAFVAEADHVLLAADYSQIELRLLAHFSQDPVLLEAFHRGADIHRETAAAFFDVPVEFVSEQMRRTAKIINFGLMYGMGPYKLSNDLNIPFGKAREFIQRYFERFSTIKEFMDRVEYEAKDRGYSQTLLGRKRWITGFTESNQHLRDGARRLAVNTPVQGTAADIIKKAMIDIAAQLQKESYDARLILQVHDELVFEVLQRDVRAVEELVVEKMSSAVSLSVPLEVSSHYALNWSDAH
ncbi:DNA polymerase I [Chitinivibrio alkaliphilus]|uniref:DNA polymerase I n=1 Tax=Chitinivibrio alkaliphilus ACht1 TaxID=1313304 RepID=U7D866_9BACT|nr:DNA polymerase I [Chitinivibrio alkaliphilus]ERP32133.1 DNA polymerase type I [Chitinivibrio alkaliphilus ACht1]